MSLQTSVDEDQESQAASWPAGILLPGGEPGAYPRDASIHALFEAEAGAAPDAVALEDPERSVTYGELNRRADRLAHYLLALGIRPGDLVGLCLGRSVELVTGMLAALKAGGAYLPLDPAYPAARLSFMLADAAPAALITTRELAAYLPAHGAREILLDVPLDGPALADGEAPVPEVAAEDLAYVLFTSGSTGRPKGVEVPHRGVVRLVRGNDFALFGPDEVFLHLTSPTFDLSTFEVWGALLNGGRLALFPGRTPSLTEIGEAIQRHGVTTLWLTSGLFHSMVDEAPSGLRGLRQLLAGGDVVSPTHARRALTALPGCTLINGYGPTENTTFTCCHSMARAADVEAPVPIGLAIGQTSVHILDGGLLPVPAGEAGELCTGGDGLARGYLRRPDLTAERFVPDPFGDGDRLYRTGDLARSRPDGAFDFLGRADRQVKVRGFRIELGEIEETLLAHPVVAAAVVAAREDRDGDKVLVAYVAAQEEGGRSDGETLRAFLAERLPDFMVPPFVVQLPALPLDPNGKVDRAALPAPDLSGATAATAGTAPRTPLEETLAGLWRELLGLSEVGVHDDFFALGGHSLLAGRLVARLRSTLGAELTLRDFSREPTIAGLAARLAPAEELPRFESAPRDVPLPLSYNQERVWFLDRLVPGNLAYNTQLTVHFEGPLDPGVYRWALREIVKRHEIFRTAFLEVDGRPVQVIQPPSLAATVELPVVDLTGLPWEARPAESERLVALFVSRRFELDRPPLARWALLRLAAEEHVLIQSEHHFVHDGWSISLLLREMEVLYGAFAAGRLDPASALPPLPPVATQYAEFVLWQRRLAESPAMRRQLDYWKRKLAGCPAALELPADRPRPAMQSLRGAAPRPQLPLELCRELRALARREKTTLFHIALAAFQTLLHRYTGEEDLLVGSAVANRRVQELEAMIGMVVNMVVLRTSLAGGPPFRELLGRTRETCLEAQAHEDAQLDRIVEEIAPERHLSRNPLFQVMFSFHDSGVPDLEFAGLRGRVVERPNGSAKMDLNIIVVPRAEQRVGRERRDDDGIAVLWEYSTDLFEAPTIERMLGHYLSLLEGAVGDPDRRLADLPLLSATERRQLLVEWNDTAATAENNGPGATLHALVFAQAARTPEAVALVHRDHQLTYGELARRSLGLARRLRALGIGPEARVAVCLERSPELIAALLGTLAAGAAYVPLDPAYPAERLAFMREDSGAMAVVGEIGDLPAAGVPVLSPYETAEEWAGSAALSGNLAYVIYTSGSTGRPKGVAIEHRSATALVRWALELFSAEDLAGVFAATSVCFDLSVFELFVPLAAGGTVVLGRDALALAEPAEVPAPDRITLINTVPSAMTELLRMEAIPSSVRTVNLAGEPLKASLAREVRTRTAARRLFDLYGPSEDTTYSTFSRVEEGDEPGDPGDPVIGRPVAGTRAYLVDRRLGLVPAGIPGEICLGGAGLARGYLNRLDLTAERFVPDPFGSEPGGRLYRTGDLARFLVTGEIDFLGRIDHQVKVRGFRVELGEVEAALAACPGVREATAQVRDGSLVAWIVPETVGDDLGEALARQVGQRLPAPLVPSRFVMVEALPLTPNGKVDRRALARRPLPGTAAGAEDAMPRGPVEELLAGLWSRLLGVERIGRDDRFFALGGHSLLGTQVVSRVRDTFGVDLPLRLLFERPTIARLAKAVEAALAGTTPDAGRIPRAGRESPLPLSFGQERLWVMERLSPGRSAYHMSRAYTLSGALDAAALEAALNEVVRRHEALRTAFGTVSGRPVQTVLPYSPAPLPRVDLSALPAALREQAVRELAAALVRQPFDLAAGRLLRPALLRRSESEHVLVLVLHHIASDGLSIRLVTRELSALYAALAAGRSSSLPEPAVQYADWAAWQRQRLRGDALAGHLAVWRRRLAGAPTVLELPTDRPRLAEPSFRGGMLRRTFGEPLRRSLEALAREQGVTPFMALFTGFALLLARWSGRRDLLLGVDASQRDRVELEGLIGLFVNQLVLRADLTGNPALRTVLQRTREVSLEAFTHQELPFDKLVEDLRPERELGRNPLFQVMFVFQDAPDAPPDLAGLDVSRRELEVETAPFDLTLFVTPLSEGAEGAAGGLQAALRYSADLFTAATADRLLRDYEALLESLPRNLDTPLESFAMTDPSPVSPVSGVPRKNPRRESALDSLLKVKPKAVDLERQVRAAEGRFPVVLRPGLDGVDAVAWAAVHRAALEEELRRSGAVLLRGFGLHDTARFQELVRAAFGDLIEYGERSSPRSRVDGRVYTSSDHPADQEILLHTEQSYTLHWPLKICFCCLRKAARGGETPIADTRRILARLRPEVVEAFERRQVLYVRNYGSGLGLPWTEVFQTTDREAVEAYCRASHIEVEWRGDDGLRTSQVRPAVRRHPRTREKVWFNHGLFFHVTSLPPAARDSLLASFAEEDLPVNTYYGDGGPIEPEVLEEIRRAYRDETVSFPWEEGDVLLLDNMLAAHGRAPFEGERRVVVAMAEPISADDPTEGW